MENVICLQRFVSRQIAARDSLPEIFPRKVGVKLKMLSTESTLSIRVKHCLRCGKER